MQFQAKWLRSATITALLAVMALFVSPAFALGCCCGGPAVHAALTSPAPEAASHSCCADDEVPTGKVAAATQAVPHCSTIEKVCDCAEISADQPFVSSDNSHYPHFVPVVAVLPEGQYFTAPRENVRLATYVCYAARPRSPSLFTAAGRAPPALALS